MQQPTPTSLPLLHGRYRIEERLGVGRLAAVYRAYDERLQRPVLIHMLRRELAGQEALRQRFVQEAQSSAQRAHRSLLDVYDSGELAGRPYMVTEYVAGRSLREIGALSLEDALLYFRQVVGAVAVCQAAGVPHPPISSNNVILVEDGHVELLESWLLPPGEVARDLASYRAPERASGGPLSPASAVYSLGLLLLEMLSGRRVIDGDDPQAIAQAHQRARIPALAELQPRIYSPGLERLIESATARAPEQRPPDAAALAQELDALRHDMAGDTVPLLLAPDTRPPLRAARPRGDAGHPSQNASARAEPHAPQAPAPQRGRAPLATGPRQRAARRRSTVGLVIMVALFLAVGCGAYSLASAAIERLANVQLPRPSLDLPDLGLNLPEWLTGVASGGGEVLVVTIRDVEGLNLRAEPGLNTQVVALLPNGTPVRLIEGARVVDDVTWVRVRAQVNGRETEGWVSARYLKPA